MYTSNIVVIANIIHEKHEDFWAFPAVQDNSKCLRQDRYAGHIPIKYEY